MIGSSGRWQRPRSWNSEGCVTPTFGPPHSDHLSIAVKELIPIVMAAAIWGDGWRGQIIGFTSDNEAVVAGLNSAYSKSPIMAHLLRCLCLYICRSVWFLVWS